MMLPAERAALMAMLSMGWSACDMGGLLDEGAVEGDKERRSGQCPQQNAAF
jgi:hypothetical protein